MSLAKYEIFNTVVETGSLTKAGQVLKISQSAVSHALQSLEGEFNLTLLVRNRSGIYLTETGKRLLPYIREILFINGKMNQEVAEINGLEVGTVRVGTFPGVTIQWLPGIIQKFSEQYPTIGIKVLEGSTEEIYNWLVHGEVDFGFVTLPVQEPLEALYLKKDSIYVVLPQNHSLAEAEELTFEQICNEHFILPKKQGRKEINAMLDQYQAKPTIEFELENEVAIISMIQKQLGISILPELVLNQLPSDVRKIKLADGLYRSIGIGSLSLNRMAPAAEKFLATVSLWLNGEY